MIKKNTTKELIVGSLKESINEYGIKWREY
jgi:hypothetical protein